MEQEMASPIWDRGDVARGGNATGMTRRDVLAVTALGAVVGAPAIARAAGPAGQLTWGTPVSLSPVLFDPAQTSGLTTPFMVLYALQDAIVNPMARNAPPPSLPESLSSSGARPTH